MNYRPRLDEYQIEAEELKRKRREAALSGRSIVERWPIDKS